MRRLIAPALLVLSAAAGAAPDGYVGSARCADCHQAEADAWRGSHHDLAMAEATPDTVLGDFDDATFTAHGVTSRFYRDDDGFFVRTDGPDGASHDYRVAYTFGWYPLQQYLIPFPGGKLQALGIAWDSRPAGEGGQRWFHLYPGAPMDHRDPQHWTARDQTWNYQCAECHSTNLRKGYDLATDSYRTTWSEIDVACEACHGPGAGHVAWAQAVQSASGGAAGPDKGLAVDLADRDDAVWSIDAGTGRPQRSRPRQSRTELETCARCHSRRGQIWEDDAPGRTLGSAFRLAPLSQGLYFPDGQIREEVYVYGSFLQSAMHAAGVTCSDCHEPHSLRPRAEGNALCTRCHQPGRYDTPSHHHHDAGSAAARCTACHMPQRVYMVVDERADHSLRVPRPDLSVALGTPNACNGCHQDRPADWAAGAVAAWYPDGRHRGPHFGEALHAADEGAGGAAERLMAVAADPRESGIVRASALERMAGRLEPGHLFTLPRLLADDDPLVRREAVRLLEAVDPGRQVELGWPALSDREREVRLEAARLLAPFARQRLPEQYRQQLRGAIDEYARSQQVNADRPEAHLNLGLLATALGDGGQAEAAYRTALRLDADFSPAYANLADLYRRLDRDDEGETLLRQGIDRIEGDADLRHSLGLLLVRRKRLDEALPELRRAAETAPDVPRYAYVYALALHGAGDEEGALRVLEEAGRRHPGNREILAALVTTSRDAGDLEKAKQHAERFASRYPEDPRARALLEELQGR